MAEKSQEVQPAAAAAAPELLVCKLCGLGYAAQQGRLHGKTFKCVSCDTHDRALRRNLGTQNDLQQWSVEETQTFHGHEKRQGSKAARYFLCPRRVAQVSHRRGCELLMTQSVYSAVGVQAVRSRIRGTAGTSARQNFQVCELRHARPRAAAQSWHPE